MRKYLILLALLGPACSADLLAQVPSASPELAMRFEHITEADGLLRNNIKTILQNHMGFSWFGTPNGLVRFDGVDMQIYDLDASLRPYDLEIRALCEDPDGNLWVGSGAGLYRFERTTGLFMR